MGSRHKARTLAVQALYAWEMNPHAREDALTLKWLAEKEEALAQDTRAFAVLLAQGAVEKLEQIDALIKASLKNWDFSRVSRVDLSILRLGVYELKFGDKAETGVIIDEAVMLSRELSSPDSYRFINGILDAIGKQA
jgi:N utilization substance protein B